MSRIVFFFEQIANGLYLICAVGLLFSLRSWVLSRRELWAAEFELEREHALRRQAGAITWTLGIIEIALAIYAIANVIAPTLRNDLVGGDSPAPDVVDNQPFMTSTPGGDGSAGVSDLMLTVTAAAKDEGSGPRIQPTPTLSPTPVGTIIAGMPTPVGCNTQDAWLEVPANGMVVFDSLTVVGIAKTNDFALYKFELSGPSTGNAFTPVGGDKTSAVPQKGTLGLLPLNTFQVGQYFFRLAVFDSKSVMRASCTVTVVLRERPPTPTPPGGK